MASKRLKKDDWLDLGFSMLAKDGPDGLKLERICEAADKTRGSFYHHFSTHEAFVTALMERWEKTFTNDILDRINAAPRDSSRRELLAGYAVSLDFNVEREVRRLASSDEIAATVLKRVDAHRIAFITNFYQEELQVNADHALIITEIVYSAFIGMIVVFKGRPMDWNVQFARWLQMMVSAAAEYANSLSPDDTSGG